jgi:hypothetical protein
MGDFVYLKVSPMRGMRRFKVKGKLAPRYVGPFQILVRKGEVAYQLELLPQLSDVHDVFTYLSLRSAYEFQKSRYRGNNFISEETYHTTRGHLSYNERSIRILDTTERVTHSKVIKMCKVQWSHHSEDEATWEHEEERISDYPKLFPSASESRG